jgi:hypothetical protein
LNCSEEGLSVRSDTVFPAGVAGMLVGTVASYRLWSFSPTLPTSTDLLDDVALSILDRCGTNRLVVPARTGAYGLCSWTRGFLRLWPLGPDMMLFACL